jgi:hypothetical protein
LARDDERKTVHAEAMIQVAMIWLMAARLAGEQLPEPCSDVEKEAARRLAEGPQRLTVEVSQHAL